MPERLVPLPRATWAHNTARIRAMERAASTLAERPSLMELAGLAGAQLLRAVHPHARQVDVLCGPGNNGGDGLVLARLLHAQGLRVTVHQWGAPSAQPDRAQALAGALDAGVALSHGTAPGADADCVVDALLGIGLREAPRGAMAQAIEVLRASHAPILALDTPSGLDIDSGQDHGAARARWTLSYIAAKPGLFTGAGRDLCGDLWLADLGAAPSAPGITRLVGATQLQEWARWSPRAAMPHGGHKGRQGDAWILGGSPGMEGAARLAGRAALAAGAGRVYLVGCTGDPVQPELMQRSQIPVAQTVVAGCGAGPTIDQHLPDLLLNAAQLVLDADALNALASQHDWAADLQARRGRPTVLTPHPLEAARLLKCTTADVQANRLACAQTLADNAQCTVVLKGSGTIVAHPGRPPWLNTTGHSALATAGTGDVLAGWLGGLMAQAPQAPTDELAALAVAWHGAAAEGCPLAGGPLVASQLIARMAALHPA